MKRKLDDGGWDGGSIRSRKKMRKAKPTEIEVVTDSKELDGFIIGEGR